MGTVAKRKKVSDDDQQMKHVGLAAQPRIATADHFVKLVEADSHIHIL